MEMIECASSCGERVSGTLLRCLQCLLCTQAGLPNRLPRVLLCLGGCPGEGGHQARRGSAE